MPGGRRRRPSAASTATSARPRHAREPPSGCRRSRARHACPAGSASFRTADASSTSPRTRQATTDTMRAPKVASGAAAPAGQGRGAGRRRGRSGCPGGRARRRRRRPSPAAGAVVARALGAVERDVGGLDQRGGVAHAGLERAHADADRDAQRRAVGQRELERLDGAADALADRPRAARGRSPPGSRELVAAVAGRARRWRGMSRRSPPRPPAARRRRTGARRCR